MAQVKVSIGKMPVPKKIQFVRQIVQEMKKNGKFNSPSPDLATLANAAAALEAAYNSAQAARATAKEQTSIMNQKVSTLETLVMQEANYVQSVSAATKPPLKAPDLPCEPNPRASGNWKLPPCEGSPRSN
jgi:hypothetical protein